MELSDSELQHLAKLSALSLNDEEAHLLREELGAILGYVKTLESAPTRGVAPTSHLHGNGNVTRDDINQKSLAPDEVKALAPDFAHGGFRVPKVL